MSKVLITGASRGIGKAIVEKFLFEGWHVLGTSTSGRSSIEHPNFKIYKLRLEEPQDIDQLAQELINSKEKIDALINNAGVYLNEDDFPIPEPTLRKTFEVNLIGMILLTDKLLPIVTDGGHIVNMSSEAGAINDFPDAHRPSYQISKVGVNMFTRCLTDYVRGRNIMISSFDPGWVRTDMGGADATRDPKEPALEMFQLVTSKVESGLFWRRGKKREW